MACTSLSSLFWRGVRIEDMVETQQKADEPGPGHRACLHFDNLVVGICERLWNLLFASMVLPAGWSGPPMSKQASERSAALRRPSVAFDPLLIRSRHQVVTDHRGASSNAVQSCPITPEEPPCCLALSNPWSVASLSLPRSARSGCGIAKGLTLRRSLATKDVPTDLLSRPMPSAPVVSPAFVRTILGSSGRRQRLPYDLLPNSAHTFSI